jgi:hypothetical protein
MVPRLIVVSRVVLLLTALELHRKHRGARHYDCVNSPTEPRHIDHRPIIVRVPVREW